MTVRGAKIIAGRQVASLLVEEKGVVSSISSPPFSSPFVLSPLSYLALALLFFFSSPPPFSPSPPFFKIQLHKHEKKA
jgi:hypothetical protein